MSGKKGMEREGEGRKKGENEELFTF